MKTKLQTIGYTAETVRLKINTTAAYFQPKTSEFSPAEKRLQERFLTVVVSCFFSFVLMTIIYVLHKQYQRWKQ